MSRFTDTLNAQVGNEFGASQQYVAIAVWYDAETLPQLAAFFYRQAVEERNHAMMLVQYLLDAGEAVVIPGIEAPRTTFADPVEPVALALAQERRVTDQISALVEIAREEGNRIGEQYLQWFLKEQLEEMSSMSALLRTVERAAAVNILLTEDYLARTAGAGAGPEADAPRAAGGVL
jgi:ferritin